MRIERTLSEQRILDRLGPVLKSANIYPFEIDGNIVDAPDIVVRHGASALGIEIMRLDYEHYCKWLSTPRGEEYSRAAEVTVNLHKLLVNALKKKRKKYAKYIQRHSLDECWLIFHNNLFEFAESDQSGIPDRKWFEDYSSYELQEQNCPFDKVLFNLEHPDLWYKLFDKSIKKTRHAHIRRWPTIIFREAAIKTTLGVNVIDLRDQPGRPSFE